MNEDEIGSLVRQILTMVLSSASATAFVSSNQATAIAAGLGALASVAWSIYAHWGKKKVSEKAVVLPGSG